MSAKAIYASLERSAIFDTLDDPLSFQSWRERNEMQSDGLTRRRVLKLASATAATLSGLGYVPPAFADLQADNAAWLSNPAESKLIGADGLPVVGLPARMLMRNFRAWRNGFIEVWVPRFGLYGWCRQAIGGRRRGGAQPTGSRR